MNMAIVNSPKTLDDLCIELDALKGQIAARQKLVAELEQEIAAKVGVKDEGAFSVKCDGYKVTTEQRINRTVNADMARDVASRLPQDIADSVFAWKPSLSLRVYKDLEKYQPDTFREVSRAVTAKPGKVSVKLEAL